MTRQFQINGECMVTVSAGPFGGSNQLGLSTDPIVVTLRDEFIDLIVNSFGKSIPNVEWMGVEAIITMNLIHFDYNVMEQCIASSMASNAVGTLPHAGTLMGTDLPGTNQQFFFTLTLSSPVLNKPYVFPAAYLHSQPVSFNIGAERTVMTCQFRAIPYAADPATANGVVLYHH
jgi:hypothetical protein